MKRVVMLIGLVVFVMWVGAPGRTVLASAGAPRAAAAHGGETNPYYVCSGRSCVEQSGCGLSSCSNDQDCGACDPVARDACLAQGWIWDDVACTCTSPCNPADRDWCIANWGTWDDVYCVCYNPCNPGPPIFIDGWQTDPMIVGCTGCMTALYTYRVSNTYEQHCEDGRVWDTWEETTDYYYEDYAWECYSWCLEY